MHTIELRNGSRMPTLGLGTWKMDDAEAERVVGEALEMGYRHIDTATLYANETGVGRAIRASSVPREEIFVTTKLHPSNFDAPRAALEMSLERLGLPYVDLYLIHAPRADMPEDIWHSMERIYGDETARAIGVSNFGISELEPLVGSKVPPMVNQVRCTPFDFDRELFDYCAAKGVVFEAYSPLGRGAHFSDETIARIAEKYARTPAQVLLRWNIEHGMVTIPKSSDHERMRENLAIFDFSLEADDVAALDALSH